MDGTRRNSMKLDIEAVRLSENDHDQPTEIYKQVSEFDTNDKPNEANMTRDKNDAVDDGADQKMLDADEKEQLARKDEVKFIKSDRSNGDAKIDIGNIEKTVGGMTKEELLKFANDPFWQRLRWTFFILFWALWVAMLAGAIWIILKAPKCPTPQKLAWYQEGPLVVANVHIKNDEVVINKLKSIGAKGVIYSLPADKTYSIVSENQTIVSEVETYVTSLVKDFENTGIQLIFDLTPNYVTTEDDLFKKAKNNETYQSAFIWKNISTNPPNNWLSKVNNTPAWHLVKTDHHVLSQFGDSNIDLQLNDTIAKEYFKNVLRKLVKLGVKGFRLANAKHYIIDQNIPADSLISDKSLDSRHDEYKFWTHNGSTYQPGLNKLLHEFWTVVNNETDGKGFLSVTDYIERPEVFKNENSNKFDFDLPPVVDLTPTLLEESSDTANKLHTRLTMSPFGRIGENFWPQWPEVVAKDTTESTLHYYIFLSLLPGVPILSYDSIKNADNSTLETIKKLEDIRSKPPYQQANFEVYTANNNTVIAYSRLKSSSPGYFVVYNPTNANVTADFSAVHSLAEQLTMEIQSIKPHQDKNMEKIPSKAIPLQAKSAVIFTYVPKA